MSRRLRLFDAVSAAAIALLATSVVCGQQSSGDWQNIVMETAAKEMGAPVSPVEYATDWQSVVLQTAAEEVGAPATPMEDAIADGELDQEPGLVDDLLNMDVDQLSNVQVNLPVETTPATLTETTANVIPAAITRITQEDIYRSGARSLNELLEIYVPDLQWIRHHWEQSHIGLRGIISDREDKYLLLVNGRIMNDKTHYGAASERDLVQLKDIHHVDVIRGPGSAVLGPGAISMVICIYTDTAKTFEGTQAFARGGIRDEFASLELKHARQWKDAEGGILLYGGFGSRDGADQRYAPLVFGASDNPNPEPWDPSLPANGGTPPLYDGYRAGQNVGNPINNDHESFRGQMPFKAFADITYNDLEIWARYTRSGEEFELAPSAGMHFPGGFGSFITNPPVQSGSGNQQTTVHSRYETELREDLRFIATLGWDSSEFARDLFFGIAEAYREEELNGRTIFISELGDHQIAYGAEYYFDWFGLQGNLIDAPATNGRLGANFTPWETQTYSLLMEDQWQLADDWTWFVGGRLDKNTYTPWMYSPRAALVWTPAEGWAWKGILNRSVRMNFAEELRAGWLNAGVLSDPEILRSYELRCERQASKDVSWAVSAFYIDLDAISWNGTNSALTGNQTQWGTEIEFFARRRYCNLIFSHSYVQLLDFSLLNPATVSYISAAANGFGNDLNAWSDHQTKLIINRDLNYNWSTDLSIRYYWGFPGSADILARGNADANISPDSEPNWKRPFRDSVFLNLGLGYRYNDYVRCRLDGYNLLGGFDKDLNKRIYHGDMGFRSEAPALGLSAEVTY